MQIMVLDKNNELQWWFVGFYATKYSSTQRLSFWIKKVGIVHLNMFNSIDIRAEMNLK